MLESLTEKRALFGKLAKNTVRTVLGRISIFTKNWTRVSVLFWLVPLLSLRKWTISSLTICTKLTQPGPRQWFQRQLKWTTQFLSLFRPLIACSC